MTIFNSDEAARRAEICHCNLPMPATIVSVSMIDISAVLRSDTSMPASVVSRIFINCRRYDGNALLARLAGQAWPTGLPWLALLPADGKRRRSLADSTQRRSGSVSNAWLAQLLC